MTRPARVPRAAAAAAAGALALAVSGCAAPGLRVEGTATATPRASTVAPSLPAKALANIRNLDLRSTLLADSRVPAPLRTIVADCSVCGIDNPVFEDVTGDKRADVVVPIYDNDVQAGTVAYGVVDGAVRLLFAHYGHQGTVDVRDGDLVMTRWQYAAGDERCCPTGAYEVTTYRWQGGRFVQVKQIGHEPDLHFWDKNDTVVL